MSIQVAKKELESLTAFQRDIHVTNDMSEEIASLFYRTFLKSTWFSSVLMKLRSANDSDDVVYHVNNSFHFLLYSYMRFVLPPIKVKSDFIGRVKIAWCHNVGTNITHRAVFREDDDVYQTWDNIWTDIYFQFYQNAGPGKRENHNIGIGNVECIEGWNDYLPSYPINVDQPWFYSMDHSLAFPIFYKNSETRAEHRYQFRRKVVDLLRVKILGKDRKWHPTTRNIHRYLDIDPKLTIKEPELWGRYAYITEPEIKWYKCKQNRTFYTRDIEICDTPNPYKYKSTSELSLQCTNPCLALFWVAENQDAVFVHNYSNYTTDSENVYGGWDPIKTTTLSYGTIKRLDNMPSDHFSIAEPRKHFPSSPSERGYHAHSYAWDSTDFNGDVGITFAGLNANLACKIDNNSIYNNSVFDDDDDDDDPDEIADFIADDNTPQHTKHSNKIETITDESLSPNFIVRSRLLIVRKFTITSGDEADKYKFSIK